MFSQKPDSESYRRIIADTIQKLIQLKNHDSTNSKLH